MLFLLESAVANCADYLFFLFAVFMVHQRLVNGLKPVWHLLAVESEHSIWHCPDADE